MTGYHRTTPRLNVPLVNTRWWEQAACIGTDQKLWFPAPSASGYQRISDEAKAICATCPVSGACLEDAHAHPADQSVRAGMTQRTRSRARARRTA